MGNRLSIASAKVAHRIFDSPFDDSPVSSLPSYLLLKRLRLSLHPAEHLLIREGLQTLRARIEVPFCVGSLVFVTYFVQKGAVEFLVAVIKMFSHDQEIVREAIHILLSFTRVEVGLDRLIKCDGHYVFYRALDAFNDDDWIREDCEYLVEQLNARGGMMSIILLRDVITEVGYCDKCRHLAHYRKSSYSWLDTSVDKEKHPNIPEWEIRQYIDKEGLEEERREMDLARIKLIADALQNYQHYGRLQEVGMEAIISLARGGLHLNHYIEHEDLVSSLIESMNRCLKAYPQRKSIIWKCLRAMCECAYHAPSLALELLKAKDCVMNIGNLYRDVEDADIRQEVLFLLSYLTETAISKEVFNNAAIYGILYKLIWKSKKNEIIRDEDRLVIPVKLQYFYSQGECEAMIKAEVDKRKAKAKGDIDEKVQKAKQASAEAEAIALLQQTKPMYGVSTDIKIDTKTKRSMKDSTDDDDGSENEKVDNKSGKSTATLQNETGRRQSSRRKSSFYDIDASTGSITVNIERKKSSTSRAKVVTPREKVLPLNE